MKYIAITLVALLAIAWHPAPVPPLPLPKPPLPFVPPPAPPPLPPAPPAPGPTPKATPPQHHGGHHHRLFCFYNPAQTLICVIVGGIVIDKVKRVAEGPACATMGLRQSWFGKVRDAPEIWLPLCSWQPGHHHRVKKSKAKLKAVVIRPKLWPNGK